MSPVSKRETRKEAAAHDELWSAGHGDMSGEQTEVSRRHSTCGSRREGPNVEMSEAPNELDAGVESDRMSQASARHGIA